MVQGIQPGRAMTGLGTQIVNQMVRGELQGVSFREPALTLNHRHIEKARYQTKVCTLSSEKLMRKTNATA